jgi:hypothetical protein
METNAYLIGRLLSLADRLHRDYCDRERKGEYPPQLLGNALMATALENPMAGLARLADRLPLYYRGVHASDPLRDELGNIERSMDKGALPVRCNDLEKAQMLLGYLARTDAAETIEKNPDPHGEPK